MPRAAGYVARKCKTTQLRARSTAALRIVFGRSMPRPYAFVFGRSMPRPYGLSRLTDELHQRLEQPWLLVWPHAQDAMLAGR